MVETFKINTNMDLSQHFAASENAFLNQLRKNGNYLHDTDYQAFCSTVYNARKALMTPMSDYDFRIYDNAAIANDKGRGMPNPYDSAWRKYHEILAAKERRDAQQHAEPTNKSSKRPMADTNEDDFMGGKFVGDSDSMMFYSMDSEPVRKRPRY